MSITSNKARDRARHKAQMWGGEDEDYLEHPAHRAWDDKRLTQVGFWLAATYRYTTKTGQLLYEVLRYEHQFVKGEKMFMQRMPSGETVSDVDWFASAGYVKVPYHWAQLATRADELVHFTEGEKDADRLMREGLLATTVAGQNWSHTAVQALAGRDVIIYVDNDAEGRENSRAALEALQGSARSLKLLRLPNLLHKEDVSDWLDKHGHTRGELIGEILRTPEWGALVPFPDLDIRSIPRREWLYKPLYIRKFVTGTFAMGGGAKTALSMVDALSMATGRDLIGVRPIGKLVVSYWNGEDPIEELHRRFAAAMKHYGIMHSDIAGRLFVRSGRDWPIIVAEEDARKKAKLNEAVVENLITNYRRNHVDAVIIDPLISCHHCDENDQRAMDKIVKEAWGGVAQEADCAVHIDHHTRKMRGENVTVDDGRGASSLNAAMRHVQTLNKMSAKEAEPAQIAEVDRWRYLRADNNGKPNMVPPESAKWYHLASVDLGNSPDPMDDGDNVQVIERWDYPVVEKPKLSGSDIRLAQDKIAAGGPWRSSSQSKNEPWVGIPIARALGLKLETSAQKRAMTKLIHDWVTAGHLKRVMAPDVHREEKEYVEVDNLVHGAPYSDTSTAKNND